MRTTNQKTQRVTALTLAAALGVAIYLNWEYAKGSPVSEIDQAAAEVVAEQNETVEAAAEDTQQSVPVSDALITEQEALESSDKNYGEAQLVSVAKDSGTVFFEQARLDRTKTRDGVVDDLEKSLKKASLSKKEKEALLTQMTNYLGDVTTENEIETLIKAKGFADCLCFLKDGKADITVMTATGEGLSASQVAQLRDIILGKCKNLTAQDITIVEVK